MTGYSESKLFMLGKSMEMTIGVVGAILCLILAITGNYLLANIAFLVAVLGFIAHNKKN